ncbi:hypothetical protein F8388_015107 [Cannabis sativa]|uniref:Protein kinase domain-containing protein n=1 Tax=Cannabis sativa TaxID=3483 RepID=A0A7J6EQR9_CANSA|nr:hypothetical protein F8388_015107 [Cannabis sativa]
MTNSFTQKLGQGGFGDIYKGNLNDGSLVVVKVLNKSKGKDSEDFMNEVATISRTSHVNIVTLLGFCFERSKRALIYEFMPNGSLENVSHKSDVYSYGMMVLEMIGRRKIINVEANNTTMSRVIKMLEGSVDSLEIPPKPFLYSPPRSPPLESSQIFV